MSLDIRRFNISLITEEPFRIGALQNILSTSDNPVARVGDRVVVQGSSLKGALRAEIERYLINEHTDNPAMKPCIPSPYNTLSSDERTLIKQGIYRGDLENRKAGCMYSERGKTKAICPVCYLLGAQGLVGFVRVPFLYTDMLPEDLYSVRLDRASGVVREKTNREYQVIRDGAVFEGVLEILISDSARNWVLGKKRAIGAEAREFQGDEWLSAGTLTSDKIIDEFIIKRIEAITLLGGYKSKGCGRVKINVLEIK